GWAVLVVVCVGGCSGDGLTRVPIQGLLTAQGVPLENATVQFMPQSGTPGQGAIGTTDADGRFTLISSRESDEGIPPGKYKVRVTRLIDGDGTILPADSREADYPMSRESVPLPYSGLDSPLDADISDAGGELKLDIPQSVPGKKKT
ncbi:MAG: carboxypeptidase-like regulatory domain-containing protein, partial [Pirellulaceae bacterium]